MAVGKTTTGRALSNALACSFWDLDEQVVQTTGRSIPEIFTQEGEAAFRRYETAQLTELCHHHGVLSLGGGTVSWPGNLELLQEWRIYVLMAPWDILSPRLANTNRPNAPHAQELYHQRQSDWKKAGVWLDARQPTDQLVQQIVQSSLEARSHMNPLPRFSSPTG